MIRQRSEFVYGVGLHSGKDVKAYLGVVDKSLYDGRSKMGFGFMDSEGKPSLSVTLDANPFTVKDTTLCTVIGNNVDDTKMSTIEHFMAVMWAYGLNMFKLYVDNQELPILDGSARDWVKYMNKLGIRQPGTICDPIIIDREIVVEYKDSYLKISPAPRFSVDITIDFPYKSIGRQRYNEELNYNSFIKDLSYCRTFVHLNDATYLKMNGMALGGSLDNAIVVDDNKVLNPEGLRHPEEFVRHKVLDLVGDLWILGRPIIGKIEGYKPGHTVNNLLARKIFGSLLG